jgi:hypothetical protein
MLKKVVCRAGANHSTVPEDEKFHSFPQLKTAQLSQNTINNIKLSGIIKKCQWYCNS